MLVMSYVMVMDIYLYMFKMEFVGLGYVKGSVLYLMISFEFYMKCLLVVGSGCIYQLGKVFCNEENGCYYNLEFIMLEWYWIGFDYYVLMDEMDVLL